METVVGATDLTSVEVFKSYYVVWKPEKKAAAAAEKACLNRTM